MAQIFLIKIPSAFEGNGKVHIFTSSGISVQDLISRDVLEPVKSPCFDVQSAENFIKDYIDFIAQLNHQFEGKLLWWATDLSSKNRYMSESPDNIQELVEILTVLSCYKDQPVLIVDPSAAVEVSLRKALKTLNLKVQWRVPAGRAWFECTASRVKKIGGVFYNSLKYYGRSVYAQVFLRKYFRDKLSKARKYYVIKTFTYASSWDEQGGYREFIFGRLAEFLAQKDIFVWTFDSRNFRGLIKEIVKGKGPFLLPVEFFLSFKDVVNAVARVLFFRLRIEKPFYFRGIDVTDVIRYELAKQFNGIQMVQYFHYYATQHLVEAMNVETFLLNYENNPWERMCILALRKYSPASKILSYQTSIVPQAALNMFVSSQEKSIVPMPDVILAPGRIPLEIMTKYGDFSELAVKTSCGLRYENHFKVAPMPRGFRKSILIILDGVKQTRQFLDYILKEIDGLPDYQFILRAHPMMPWPVLSSGYGYEVERMGNISISRESLTQDLKDADIVIYWQSSVSFEALSMGKPLINFNPDSILSFDPLHGHSSLKWKVSAKGSLKAVLAEIYGLSNEAYEFQYQQSKEYISQYFFPVTKERVQPFWA